jgi:hypothetical protein
LSAIQALRTRPDSWCPDWFIEDLCRVTPDELDKIRGLDDFDLTVFVTDLRDHGWAAAAETLGLMDT